MFKAEWEEDGVYCYKIFDNEKDAYDFANDAYLDCLTVVGIRPLTPPEIDREEEYALYMVEANQP